MKIWNNDNELFNLGQCLFLKQMFLPKSLKVLLILFMNKSFGIMFEALDYLRHYEVYICTVSSYNYALWGG